MGQLVLNVGDSHSWNPIWNTQVDSASAPNRNYYYPIPEIEVPLLLDKFVLAVYADSETARPHWHSAGFANQKLRSGITVGGNPDARFNGSHRIWLKRIAILVLPRVSNEYSLSFDIHPWHEEISLQLWEYVGDTSDSTENLINEVRSNELSRIEIKVDEIATYNR